MTRLRYGKSALAVILVAAVIASSAIYALMIRPLPPPDHTLTTTTPAGPVEDVDEVKVFKSYDELRNFLDNIARESKLAAAWGYGYYGKFGGEFEVVAQASVTTGVPQATVTYTFVPEGSPGAPKQPEPWYSTTNVQVEGVDEIDFFKSDGRYFYIVGGESWSDGAAYSFVYIVKAYPPEEMGIVSKIAFVNTSVVGLYVIPGANRLVVVNQSIPRLYWIAEVEGVSTPSSIVPPPRYFIPNTSVLVYDISDRTSPKLISKATFSGSFRASRLIGTNVYVIVTEPVIVYGPSPGNVTTLVPLLNGEPIPPETIKYVATANIIVPTNYVSIYVQDVETGDEGMESYMLPYPEWIYVSANNIYVVSPRWYLIEEKFMDFLNKTILPLLPPKVRENITAIITNENLSVWDKEISVMEAFSEYLWSLTPEERKAFVEQAKTLLDTYFIGTSTTYTDIYKISMSGLDTALTAMGSVPGRVTDQFSMDEYGGYFRVATTSDVIKSFHVENVVWSTGEVVIDEGKVVRPPPIVIWPEIEQTNNVYVLDKELKIVGKLEGIEPGESIYAARFMGTYMFLVTFRRVDPLFAIDLSDPENPAIIGYVKIPGYSEYLHPYGDHYLIGVGFEADESGRIKGLKVSLFDVSDLSNIQEVSKITVEGHWAYTPALGDHKAFLLNPSKGYLAIPVTEYAEEGSKTSLYVININNDGNLTLRGNVTVKSATRAAYIYDIIYAVSPEIVTAIDYGNMSVINAVELSQEIFFP